MEYLSKNSDTIDGYTRINGIKPPYKLCSFRQTVRRDQKRYYFDYYVYNEFKDKFFTTPHSTKYPLIEQVGVKKLG